jgi:hypothetical protein
MDEDIEEAENFKLTITVGILNRVKYFTPRSNLVYPNVLFEAIIEN